MIVISIDAAPKTVRGELTKWMIEIKPGVFVGNLNKRIRELLWIRICSSRGIKGAVLIYSNNNEQGYSIQTYGIPNRSVVELDGIQLIMIKT